MIKKSSVVIIVIVTVVLTICVLFGLLILSGILDLFLVKETDTFGDFNKAVNIIERYYYHPVDQTELTTAAIDGMVLALDDPYAEYYDEQDWIEFQKAQRGEYSGIGVMVSYDEDEKAVLITKVFDDTGAQKAGIQIGDLIIGANGQSFNSFSYEAIVSAIRGEAGTTVTVTVSRKEDIFDLDVIRQVVISDQGEYEITEDNIGLLTLYSFSGNSLEIFKKALDHFEQKNCESMIIDLRNNPGGDLEIVTNMLDILLPEGYLIITKDRTGSESTISSDAAFNDIELVVLTNEYSASASELFSIAVQDYERGLIVGETTFGKGVVQSIMPLSVGKTGLKLTTSEYFSPLGRSIHEKGVYPDHYVVDEDIFDEKDKQLDFALDLLTK